MPEPRSQEATHRSSEPLFSVVMPTYNRAHVVWKAISSVLSQTCPAWELIVVDDESTDATLRVLEEFQDPRLRVVQVPHGGPSRARNAGLGKARAPFVAYLDSDNTWSPHFLESFAPLLGGSEVMWFCGRTKVIWERRLDRSWHLVEERSQPAQALDEEQIWALHAPDVNCLVHRRDAALGIGGWDPDCHWIEDWDFFLRLWLGNEGCCGHLPDQLVEYRQVHGEGADGICAEMRENGDMELQARRYLIEKWQWHEKFDPQKLIPGDLEPIRAKRPARRTREAAPTWIAAAAAAADGSSSRR